jgi:hypothetical protein
LYDKALIINLMTETIQLSLVNSARFAISRANGRLFDLTAGDIIELYRAGKWQRGQIARNLWGEYCAVLAEGQVVRLVVGLPARLPSGPEDVV